MKLLKNRIKRNNRKNQRKVIKEYINEMITKRETARNLSVMVLTAVRDVYGFGKKRLNDLIEKVKFTAECFKEKYLTIEDIHTAIFEETGYKIGVSHRRAKKYVSRVDENIDIWADRMMAFFLLAIRDLFGFGAKRLDAVHKACAGIGVKMVNEEINILDLRKDLLMLGVNIGAI